MYMDAYTIFLSSVVCILVCLLLRCCFFLCGDRTVSEIHFINKDIDKIVTRAMNESNNSSNDGKHTSLQESHNHVNANECHDASKNSVNKQIHADEEKRPVESLIPAYVEVSICTE